MSFNVIQCHSMSFNVIQCHSIQCVAGYDSCQSAVEYSQIKQLLNIFKSSSCWVLFKSSGCQYYSS
jgi:hypothetical protein